MSETPRQGDEKTVIVYLSLQDVEWTHHVDGQPDPHLSELTAANRRRLAGEDPGPPPRVSVRLQARVTGAWLGQPEAAAED
jgi:hypothetical protein